MGSNTFSTPSPTSHSDADVFRALSRIRQLVRILRIGDGPAEKATGLSSAQIFVLQQLTDSEATSINDLADRTLTDQSSVSAVVSKLEAKGLVDRIRSPEDARRVSVRITPVGISRLQNSPPTVQTQLIQALRQRPAHALHTFTQELTHIIAQLTAAQEHSPTVCDEDGDATGFR
jgi:DNA-binding MarR family transcriptional regulator